MSAVAPSYAPAGRHCHYWHVGEEIFEEAENRLHAQKAILHELMK